MSRPALLLALSAALLPGLLRADETTVYKTKNADGTTTYSQIETTGAQARQVGGKDPALPQAAEQPKTQTEIACESAQANLELLSSDSVLQRDNDGDGTPETLTPEQIASEKDLAQRQVTAYCPPES